MAVAAHHRDGLLLAFNQRAAHHTDEEEDQADNLRGQQQSRGLFHSQFIAKLF